MADYTQNVWVDKSTPAVNAADLTIMENGIKDAAQNSKQRGALSSRPAAAAANKNWIWVDSASGALSYSDGSSWRDIGSGVLTKQPVDVAMATNVNVSSPGTLDAPNGLVSGTTRVLLMGQTTGSQNGIYVWNGSTSAMTRALDAATSSELPIGHLVPVAIGTGNTYEGAIFRLNSGVLGTSTMLYLGYMSPAADFAYVTLPTNVGPATDGLEIKFIADATNGVVWRLAYRAGSSSTYKWEFIGGAPLFSEVAGSAETVSTGSTYTTLATAGPSITLPAAGDYDVWIGARMWNDTGSDECAMSYDIGGTGAVDADNIDSFMGGGGIQAHNDSRPRRKTGLSAVTLTAKYKRVTGGIANFHNRWMHVLPVRVG